MNSASKLQVRLLSPWHRELETDTAVFSTFIETDQADALLCEWEPNHELFSFPRRKAWYCCEPTCQFEQIQDGTWPTIRARLDPSEFLFHAHDDLKYRVPHITHFDPIEMNRSSDRKQHCIAIVSNHGGSPRRRHPQIAYRNRFITHLGVDLFGRSQWKSYRRSVLSWPGPPKNYQGEIPGDWPAGEKRDLQAKYQGAVCLENMCEPHYFTEKFVEATAAGCVPIYKAHQTTRDGILKGASWIDPIDFDDNPSQVFDACLATSSKNVQQQNEQWLKTNTHFQSSQASAVYERIAHILADH